MQQGAECLVMIPGPRGVGVLGGLGFRAQAPQPLGREGVQHVTHGLGRTAQGVGDLGGALTVVTVQQDLGPTQGKGA